VLAAGKPQRLRDFPCAGCVTDLPPGDEPVPLLVALHGDEGGPNQVALRLWSQPAEAAGYALLAPRCPRERGCSSGSWWQWRGDPAWLAEQVEKVRERRALAPGKLFLAGWSGGASYLGLVGARLGAFDGVALCGGGLPPADEAACAPCPLPVYFAAGSRNPLHALAVSSRDYFTACGHEVRWDFLGPVDHAGELRAMTPARAADALAWLLQHPRRCAAPSPPGLSAAASATPDTPDTPDTPGTPDGSDSPDATHASDAGHAASVPAAVASGAPSTRASHRADTEPARLPRGSRCTCEAPGSNSRRGPENPGSPGSPGRAGPAAAALLAVVLRARRARAK
jgi:predicted esterase